MVFGDNFLQYRQQTAALVIVALEAVCALSIGLSLAALFGGRPPLQRQDHDDNDQKRGGKR
jgi:hypothetical protein